MNKTCSKCKQNKDVKDFYKNALYSDGYMNVCKECHKQYQQQHKKVRDPNYMKNWYRKRQSQQKGDKINNEQLIIRLLEQILDKINILLDDN